MSKRSGSRPTETVDRRPTLAVFKFASCDGCQLSILNVEDQLLAVAGAVDIVNFPEASSRILPGPYDVGLVEGSVSIGLEPESFVHQGGVGVAHLVDL